ncbi:MAG: sulfotransferase [Steroidobacteraceae bacterium]
MSETHAQHTGPFFIVGCSRSGTTLLQVLIDAHPRLAVPPESHIYDRFGPFLDIYGDLTVKRDRGRFIGALLDDSFIREWRLEAVVEDVERRVQRADRVGVIEALFSLYAERKGAVRWGDKTPEHIRHLDEIRADFPHAKLIHLVRDGRDVAEAMRRMVFGPVSAVGLAREWQREVAHWQEFCDEHGSTNTLLVRYEDLVTSPREVVGKVLQFIGEPELDTVSEYGSSSLSRELSRTQRTWHSSLCQGITAAKIGAYRQAFTAREIEIFEAIAGEHLAAYGYTPEYAVPRAASPLERAYVFFADRLVRWTRKLFHPSVVRLELQFRLRVMQQRLFSSTR